MSRLNLKQDNFGSLQSGYVSWKGWDQRNSFGQCDERCAAYFQAELAASRIQLNKNDTVLELGFGNGEFLGFCRQLEVQCIGTEIDPVLIELARNDGFRALEANSALTNLSEESTRFDLAVAFDVFEHLNVNDLIRTLIEVRKVLRPGGLLLFRVPSGDSPFSGAIQHGDLTHRTTLGSSAVAQLARSAGFELDEIREPALVYPGLDPGSLIRRVVLKSLRRLTFPIFRAVYFDGATVVLTPNMIARFTKSFEGNDK